MSAARTKSAKVTSPNRFQRVTALFREPARPWTVAALTVAAVAGAWYFVWQEVRGHVLNGDDYLVTAENVSLTPTPRWIHADIRGEAFAAASADRPLSLMDPQLTERIAAVFSLHPWVAGVRSVRKVYPACVVVDVIYRMPVLAVAGSGGLVPVDAQATVLPSGDFSPVELARFPQLVNVDSVPLGPAGERWGDARVAGAAEVVAALGSACREWRIRSIIPSPAPERPGSDDYLFALRTQGGTSILWGRAPNVGIAGELPASEKIGRLRKYFRTHGTLEGRDGPQSIDIRTLDPADRSG
ncbi:MAG: hypothetical protein ACOY3P_17500 [Planctomycetota bacterium]